MLTFQRRGHRLFVVRHEGGRSGSGDVARALAEGFLKHRHSIMMGTRDASKLESWAAEKREVQIGSFAEAARFGDVIVLAVKGTVALDALRLASAANLEGKPIIDATNPIAESAPVNGVLRFFTTHDESLMERLQREFPQANLVKAFNSVGHRRMVNPQFEGGRPTMFICGNNESARKTRRPNPRPVWLGNRRYGHGRSSARH